jgi:hypothetical protein
MRFKKLRMAVGISLVVFILVFGNIIAFGLLSQKNTIKQDNPLTYNNESSNSLTNKTKVSTTTNNNPPAKPAPVPTPTPRPKPMPPPVTRAS